MANEASPIPEAFSPLSPALGVRDAKAAIEYYREAFGANEVLRLEGPGGVILHAELDIGGALLMLAEENPEWENHSPPTLGGTPVRLHLYVDDVDEVGRRAIAAGGKVVIPIDDQFYGDRSGRIEDPFGHQWILATRVESVSPDEMQRRASELFG